MPLPKKMPKGRTSKSQDEGRVFANRYRVDKRLGSGSFGTVFLVEDMRSKGEWKVLKEIYVGELQPDETVDAMREARLLSNLNHPNIVKFLDSFIDGEFFCIVTEYCEGGDLDDKIQAWKKAGKTFDESLVLAWFIQLLMAVQHMHERRILHRDLKTRNIFLKNNIIKLGDFGISRILMGTSDMATTFTGTPYYMSPEVLKHEGYKYKSDIWSLGVVLYEMCNLEHAFQGQSLMGVMYKIVEGEVPKMSPKYSRQLHDLFSRMLDKAPAARPSAAEIIRSEFVTKQMEKLKLQMHDCLTVSARPPKLDDSRKQKSKSKPKLYQEPENRPMTPADRMKQRKQQRADEEAERLKMIVANQAAENHARYSQHKKKQSHVSLPWVADHPEVFSDRAFTGSAVESSRPSPSSCREASPEAADYDSGHADSGEEDSSLTFTNVSEIPEDADMAETFYSQFEDEFEDSEEDEDDFSALMDHMQGALEQSVSGVDRTLSEDSIGEGLTDTLKQRRIEALRAECKKILGSKAFQRAYEYLKEVRFGDEMRDEDSIMDGLSKLVDKPRDCFLVDQLLFMEKQAEIAAMT